MKRNKNPAAIFQKIILIVLNIIIINACQPPVVFSEPQPAGKKQLVTIPRQYQGIYWCETDSVTLIINKNTIYKKVEFETTLSKSDVNSNSDLFFENGRLFSKEMNQSFPAQLKNDSIVSQLVLKDTLFNISEKQIAKQFKGHLIINKQLEDRSWEVKVVSLKQKHILTIAKAEIPENFQLLESITDVEEITYKENNEIKQIKISPTKDEFNQILKQNLLFDGYCSEFKRLSAASELW